MAFPAGPQGVPEALQEPRGRINPDDLEVGSPILSVSPIRATENTGLHGPDVEPAVQLNAPRRHEPEKRRQGREIPGAVHPRVNGQDEGTQGSERRVPCSPPFRCARIVKRPAPVFRFLAPSRRAPGTVHNSPGTEIQFSTDLSLWVKPWHNPKTMAMESCAVCEIPISGPFNKWGANGPSTKIAED